MHTRSPNKCRKLISARTEGLIKALERDVELHGLEQLDIDSARFYAELALMALLELIRDYRRHRLLHRALREMAPQLDINPKELLKAYPDNRRIGSYDHSIHAGLLKGLEFPFDMQGKEVLGIWIREHYPAQVFASLYFQQQLDVVPCVYGLDLGSFKASLPGARSYSPPCEKKTGSPPSSTRRLAIWTSLQVSPKLKNAGKKPTPP